MKISIDFGGSTMDLVVWGDEGQVVFVDSHEMGDLEGEDWEDWLGQVDLDWGRVEEIVVTGGKSRGFRADYKGVPVVKLGEIEAIGKGGRFLVEGEETLLVVSMGTGTCMVKVEGEVCKHVGGTGVGGGTFLGLSKLILGETDVERLKRMFGKGETAKVDLSVKDIVGGDIGIVSGEATASNFGKLVREIDFSKDDLASGIVNLIGQTIGISAVFAALANDCEMIVLAGKLTSIGMIVDVIKKVCEVYEVKVVVPERAEYVSAIGAGVYFLKS